MVCKRAEQTGLYDSSIRGRELHAEHPAAGRTRPGRRPQSSTWEL